MFFCMYMFKEANNIKYIPYKHLLMIAEKLESVARGDTKRLIINIFPRSGKAIDMDSEILTKRGFIKARNVVVGDEFIGSNGGWTKVTGVFPQGETDLYRVQFSDKSYIDTCSEHIWSLKHVREKKVYDKKVKDLLGDLTHERDNRSKWELPMMKPVKSFGHDDEELHIDPYLLGIWIGDGSTYKAEITTMDQSIKDAFDEKYERGVRTHQNSGKAETIGYFKLITDLKKHNLLRNKHIPKEYLYGSLETRIALLQGLMDSDGFCDKRGQPSFCQKNPQVIKDFKFLAKEATGFRPQTVGRGICLFA